MTPNIRPLASYRCYYQPLNATQDSGVTGSIRLKATDCHDAMKKAWHVLQQPILSAERVEKV